MRREVAILKKCSGSITWSSCFPSVPLLTWLQEWISGHPTWRGPQLGNWAGLQFPKPTFIPLHLVFGGLWMWLSPTLDFWWRCWEPRPTKPLLGSLRGLISWPGSTASRSSLWVLCSARPTTPSHAFTLSDSPAPFKVASTHVNRHLASFLAVFLCPFLL